MEVCYQAASLRSCSEIRKQTFLFLACRSHEGTVHLLPFVLDKSSFIEPPKMSQDLLFFSFFATFGAISTFSSYLHSTDKRKFLFNLIAFVCVFASDTH